MSERIADYVSAVGQIEAVSRILEVVCRTTGMGFAAVARVTDERWIACAVHDEIEFGLRPGGELVLATTICDEIRCSGQPVVIDDVARDERYREHPTPRRYGFQSYISMPIVLPDGWFFGTLCAIDPRPIRLSKPETVEMFRLFASLIAFHLDSHGRLVASERALGDEREASQLREQFIAVLGHDLRNPLGAIRTGALLLSRLPKGKKADNVRRMIDRSVARMSELIDNVLDLTRARLGDGLLLEGTLRDDLVAVLGQVVLELESVWPSRTIIREFAIDRPAFCNASRLAQLLSNLLGNALTHGDPSGPIRVQAVTTPETFELSVVNRGSTIPPEVADQLFQPFVRGTAKPGQQGLGLGLYIASEIARAHRGTLEVDSRDGETRFTLRMPRLEGGPVG